MNNFEVTRLVRFGVCGVLATGLHIGVAVALISRAGASPALANALAFVCATCWSYLANTLWSFSSSLHLRNVSRFIAVSLGGVALTGLVSYLAQAAGAGPWAGIAMVVCIVTPLTFVTHRRWTYR
ncbi:sugar translocase [Paraburkholderia ginsengiterrae]|uniref:Sugar translocase n=1 Tax=Paraburkholderia ginsengiterrae TaxID=1462993 RepID=A0A1A9N0P9_9BURK|nr:GtrA family protein [Paraburkholderia ginsengiterrae]OAJ53550.1 sugar translocase [Paraburkholderia ginsengiterrae]OAJ58924.1 sugar translocase [Paraburkholderia ginsengiterrae]